MWAGLWQRRWLRFLLVGGVNTAASYAVYAALLWAGLAYPLANFGALVFGIGFSFRTHAALVFGQSGAARFLRYVVCWTVLYGVNVALIGAAMRAGLDAYWAGALALGPMAALSYLVQRHIVFGERT